MHRACAWLLFAGLAVVAPRTLAQHAPAPAPQTPPAAAPETKPADEGPPPEPPPVTLPVVEESSRAPRAAVAGDDVIVLLPDGHRLIGTFVSGNDKAIVVTVGGVDLTIQRADFERVTVQRPLRERYHEMRSMIDDGDSARLLLLAEWLRINGLLDDAAAELNHVEKVDPTNIDASRLSQLVERQRELNAKADEYKAAAPRAPKTAPAAPRPSTHEPGDDAERQVQGIPLLTLEQVNLMKVYEIDLGGSTKFIIERPTVERLLRDYVGNPLIPSTREGKEQFLALPAAEILNVMFRVQARELYGEVKVQGNPPGMKLFRDNVNRTWLVTSCATPGCHGSGAGGGPASSALALANRRTTSEQSFYTNFLILDRYKLAGGIPLIDYERPERSPLLQMTLPKNESARPHPDVHGWAPVFRTSEDHRFKQAVEWISSMYRPRPDYPIEYPPGDAATKGKAYEPVPR